MIRAIGYLLAAILIPFGVFSEQEELLNRADVHEVMDKILSQHVDQHEVSSAILEKSFHLYIEHFDPSKVYLLQGEVDRAVKVTPIQMKRIISQYRQGKLDKFEELNQLIQQAIRRARDYRAQILKDEDVLFQNSAHVTKNQRFSLRDSQNFFAASADDLKQRIRNQIVGYISLERFRYGDQAVLDNRKHIIRSYLDEIRHLENQYLYEDERGKALSNQEKENFFVMHVLKALASSLDSHTSFLDQNEALDMKIRLEKGFKGIGIALKQKPKGIVITRLIKDGPAMKSGKVYVGDRIISINGENVEFSSLEELVDKLRGDRGPTVSIQLKRSVEGEEQLIRVTLPRELISIEEGRVKADFVPFDGGIIGKISMDSFYQGGGITSERDMKQAIKELKDKGRLKGIIIDLRENSGGFLNQAVKVAGLFITNGVVVVSKYANGDKRFYRDMDGKVAYDGPIIILTSKATASAAEIVAQALQDYGVALIVGDEQTYGKGTIQSQTVTGGSSISHFKVTVGKYYTVSGKTPQVDGVKADIVVPSYYSKELIGEEYLEHPIASDTIPSSYQDQLADVDPGLKPWYLRYYMPTLQTKDTSWNSRLAQLQSNSRKRLSQDPVYQKFVKGNLDWIPFQEEVPELPEELDFQMREAVAIMKDMIEMEKFAYPVH